MRYQIGHRYDGTLSFLAGTRLYRRRLTSIGGWRINIAPA